MARIRTIKPEFWTDEKMAVLDPMTRLVFLGLISMADDFGRLIDNIKSIDGMLFPHTEESSREALETLAKLGRTLRYKSKAGQQLIQIVKWSDHQKVNHPGKEILPPPSPEDWAKPVTAQRLNRKPLASRKRVSREAQESDKNSSYLISTTLDQRPTTNDHPDSGESVAGSSNGSSPSGSSPGGWPAEAALLWGEKIAPVKIPRIAAPLKPVVDAHGWPKARAGIEAYICGAQEGRANIQAFANNANYWIGMGWEARRTLSGELSMTDENGDLTPLGQLVDANSRRRP